GHVAADRLTGDCHTARIQPSRHAVAYDPLRGCVALLDGDGIVRLRRRCVLDEGDGRSRAYCQLAYEAVVCFGVAQHPATTVHVHHDRQRARRAPGLDDADPHVTDRGGHGDPLLVDGRLVDRCGLEIVEDLPRCGRLQLVQVGGCGGRVD